MTDSEPAIKRMRQEDVVDELKTNVDQVTTSPNADLLKEANEALQRSNRIHVRPIVEESRLGIELFVGDKVDEFHGLIKTRYHDFVVHEVDPEGNLAQLTVLDAPEEQEPSSSTSLCDFVDEKALECIAEVNSGYLTQYRIDVTGMDKDMRTSLHHAIRASFDRVESAYISESEKKKEENGEAKVCPKEDDNDKPDSTQQVDGDSSLKVTESDSNDTKTAVVNDKKYIVVTRRNKISRKVNTWPRDRPDHTHFVLYKENKDTMDAIHNLAASINARPSSFSYAGVKDRRAATSQLVSSWRLEPKRLIAACRRFNKPPFIKVGNFCFKKDQIRLGQLKANKFDIVIRHLVYNNEGQRAIDKAMNSIRDNGFVNYFGLQRFGSRSIMTHEIGLAVLQCRWEEAVNLILSYRFDDNMQPPIVDDNKDNEKSSSETNDTNDSIAPNEAKKFNSSQDNNRRKHNGAEQHNSFIDLWKLKLDADVVFKKYPHYRFTNEGLIMKFLSKSEESSRDYLNAITSLPRYTRSMYVHSYQSLIWNKITTYRLKKYGFKVIPGDLILSSDTNITDNSLDILLSSDVADAKDENNGKSMESGNADDINSSNRKAPIEDISAKIEIATEENLGKYSIFDIVLPIIGSRVRLPENDVGEELMRLLKNDNLTLDSFKAREKFFISYGSYRKIMVKPNEVSWQIKQYSHPHQSLIETDLDRLNRAISRKDKESDDKPAFPPTSDSSDEALIVSFELPPSSYATMCLREIMKKPSTDFDNKF